MVSVIVVGSTVCAQAEWYVGGQVGLNTPQDLTDVRGTRSASGIVLSDLDLAEMIVFGAKFGGYLPNSLNWLGAEIDAYQTDSDISAQNVTISAPVLGLTVSDPISKVDLAVTTVALNLLVRYPHKTWQLSLGVGGGLNIARFGGGTAVNETALIPSLNAVAGLKYFFTDEVVVFGEYKMNYGSWSFDDNSIEVDYRTNMFLGGISYHFDM